MNIKVVTDKDGTIYVTMGQSARQMQSEDARMLSTMLLNAAKAGEQAKHFYLYEHTLSFPD